MNTLISSIIDAMKGGDPVVAIVSILLLIIIGMGIYIGFLWKRVNDERKERIKKDKELQDNKDKLQMELKELLHRYHDDYISFSDAMKDFEKILYAIQSKW